MATARIPSGCLTLLRTSINKAPNDTAVYAVGGTDKMMTSPTCSIAIATRRTWAIKAYLGFWA